MKPQRKILLIENQKWQFNLLLDSLKRKYSILPRTDKEYCTIIDNVCVYVNKGYNEDYRKKAFNYIYNLCSKENGVEAIILDHKIGGAYYCLTGIDLAKAINERFKENNKDCLPVIFLSKTEHSEKLRVDAYDDYKKDFPNKSTWVHKGYFGDEILNDEYLIKHLHPKIEQILSDSDRDRFYSALEKILAGKKDLLHEEHVKAIDFLKDLKKLEYESIDEKIRKSIIDISKTDGNYIEQVYREHIIKSNE